MEENTVIVTALISSGVISACINGIFTFITQRSIKKGIDRDNLVEEFRKKKIVALDELMEVLYQRSSECKLVVHPMEECPAFLMNSNYKYVIKDISIITSIEKAQVFLSKLEDVSSKNLFLYSEELIRTLQVMMAYMNTYIYSCKLGKLEPNLLTATLLRDDLHQIDDEISKSFKKDYFSPIVKKKYVDTSLEYKKNSHAMEKKSEETVLLKLANINDDTKNSYKINELIEHAKLCRDCSMECDLAGLYLKKER